MSGGTLKGRLHHHVGDERQTTLNTQTAQVQNIPAARVYVFGDADLDEEELLNDGGEAYELRPRGTQIHAVKRKENEKEKEPLTIERAILKGETLQKIAVKYCCDVSELKRLNNLIRDQDFFALAYIKVPVQRHGLVREHLEAEIQELHHGPGNKKLNGSVGVGAHGADSVLEVHEDHSDGEWVGISDIGSDSEERHLLVKQVSIRGQLSSQGRDAKDFLNKMDADIKKILSSTNSSKRNLEEVRTSLTCRRIYPLKQKEGLLGADWGIKFSSILAIVIIVALVTPLLYFLYYKYLKPPEIHHSPLMSSSPSLDSGS